jgi:alcohol dehydrogenase
LVLTPAFSCPTRVFSGSSLAKLLPSLLAGRRWSLITTDGWLSRGVAALVGDASTPISLVGGVPVNPKMSDVVRLASQVPNVELLVAVGGGSVIDAAKGMIALKALRGDRELIQRHLCDSAPLPDDLHPLPLIAVPTTTGTGSEVTRWATIWGEDMSKYSLVHPELCPTYAILAPELCLSMPAEVTLASGLDAASHAMESVWNCRHTPTTDVLANASLKIMRADLVRALRSPQNLEIRRSVQQASLLAGMAMGTTQTALAHSISYPFTGRFGLPHGLACSFTLPEVARFNLQESPERLRPIADAFDVVPRHLPDAIASWLTGLGIGRFVARYLRPGFIEAIGSNLINPARAGNNIRIADGNAALGIVRRSLQIIMAPAPLFQ